MQTEFDKEIDSLLREGARRGRAASIERSEGAVRGDGGVRATPSGAHLDADEQNAYAENSLPAPARNAYAAHLADCDDCRRSVTQLALAAGIPAQLEQRAAKASTQEVQRVVNWRERIGALFAPRAWRYAVPAMALLLVGAAALLVTMRGQRGEVSIAELNKTKQTTPALPDTHHAPQNDNTSALAPPGEGGATSASNSNAPLAKEEIARSAREDQEQLNSGVIVSDTDDAAPPTATGAATGNASAAPVAAELPTPMPTPVPIAQDVKVRPEAEAKVIERADELAKDVQRQGNYETNRQREQISGPRRNMEQSRNAQRGGNADISRDGSDKNESIPAPAPASPAPNASERRAAKGREADSERDARASDDNRKTGALLSSKPGVETRSVAGRKFRRAGSAWVDTAYNSSQSVTSVRRNSEQYRALVADEPELRRISDTLGGEITVVWKGRAYRIR